MKGKSTAAFGLALRAWNQGWPIGVYQFVKSAKWKIGEETALRALDQVHAETGEGGPVTWHKMGEGWSWIAPALAPRPTTPRTPGKAGSRSSGTSPRRPTGSTCSTSSPTRSSGAGSTSTDVVATLANRPGQQHVVITGRDADPRLVDAADLVVADDQGEAPDGRGPEGAEGHRVVNARPPGGGRARVRARQDHRGHRADGGAGRARPGGIRAQGRPRLHRPRTTTALATGRPGRNLDPVLVRRRPDRAAVRPRRRGRRHRGRRGRHGPVRRARAARRRAPPRTSRTLLGAPVVLVVDAAAQGRSVAALVSGFARYDPAVRLGGVIVSTGSARPGTNRSCGIAAGRDRRAGPRRAAPRRGDRRRRPGTWAWCRRPSAADAARHATGALGGPGHRGRRPRRGDRAGPHRRAAACRALGPGSRARPGARRGGPGRPAPHPPSWRSRAGRPSRSATPRRWSC